MKPQTILKHLEAGRTVTYTIRRLRGYTWGDASLIFRPQDKAIGLINITHRLKCFRFDEKPYDKPRWEATEPVPEGSFADLFEGDDEVPFGGGIPTVTNVRKIPRT